MYNSKIATYYQSIFPAAPKVPFLAQAFHHHHSLLDVGCSDGQVALGLYNLGHTVEGIDLSAEMIAVAKEIEAIDATYLDMLEVEKHFGRRAFDGLYCIGNTLVHLSDLAMVERALSAFHSVLRPGGQLVIQILNYDYILAHEPKQLPLIDNETLSFERLYHYQEEAITFETRLTIKATDESLVGSTRLLPLRKAQLEAILVAVGFTDLTWYSDYDGSPFSPDKMPLLVLAKA